MKSLDAIVIGLGAMGSAAAWQLAERGLRVLGLEAHSLVHDRGSSHGRTRICRKAYFEHPDYVPLLNAAYPLWNELESASGRRLFERCGLVLAGPPAGAVIAGTRAAAQYHHLPLEALAAEEAARRFPALCFTSDLDVLFESDAGLLYVEDGVQAQLELARRAGAELHGEVRVGEWRPDGRGVRVRTDRGDYQAARLVIAAGAWTGDLLRDLGVPLRVERRPQLWFETSHPGFSLAAGCPVFAFHLPPHFFYGFPAVDPGTVKLAEHLQPDPVAHADRLDRQLGEGDAARVADFARQRLRGVGPRIVRHSVCMYTMSPDEHFIIDRHPAHPQVTLAAGFSGHGFKFAPLVGRVLADLALDGGTALPINFLRLARFDRRGSSGLET